MRLIQWLGGWVFGACMVGSLTSTGGAVLVNAQTPSSFPYQGYLEMDGVPYNGQMNMFFYIVGNEAQEVNAAGGAEGEPQDGDALWSTTIEGVAVSQGAFTVALGNGDVFPGDLFSSNPQLFLGVKVHSNEEWVELRQKQRLLPVPYALHAKKAEQADVATTAIRADDFTVDGTLRAPTVQGQMVVSGGEVNAVGDDDAPIKISIGENSMVIDTDEIESSGKLYLQHHSNGATRVGGALEVDNNITVGGAGTVSGNLEVNGLLRLKDDKYVRGFMFIDSEEVTANDGRADAPDDLGSTSDRFCFLSTVHMVNLDNGGEGAACIVETVGNRWRLRATSTGPNLGGAECQAKCLRWNW